jgi:hypothetical protein
VTAIQIEKQPVGHLPYRLFTYSDRGRASFVRPEQVVGSTVDYRNERWIVEITLRDNLMELKFGPNEEGAAREFVSRLHDFLEEDALRNQHNAALRKGKSHE